MKKAFDNRRDPRSAEYKAGVMAVLEFRINKRKITSPYTPGTAQADAFAAGIEEGHSIWKGQESEAKG